MPDQEAKRQELYNLLGRLPNRNRPIKLLQKETQEGEKYVLEKVVLDLNGLEEVPAYFSKPLGRRSKLPTVIFNHSHGGFYNLGKEELVKDNVYLQNPPYAEVLTSLGYSVLAIDSWAFGQRSWQTESDTFKQMHWQGKSMWGMMVFDAMKAVDYLVTREDVDDKRIATLGMSMGSSMSWWLAALDVRVKVCIDICCLTDWHTLLKNRSLNVHSIYYFVYDLLNHFTTAQVNSLIAPRAHLSLAGKQDPLTPVEGLDIVEKELDEVYRSLNALDKWKLLRYEAGHVELPEMRQEIIDFLQRNL